jgi:hypothetical protein
LVIHSDEALLAAGFIFSIHFFNTHFRIEKFPMDTVIFSGRISKKEMLHERRRWYDRLVAEGRLDEYRVRDEWLRWKSIAQTFGYGFFGLGVILRYKPGMKGMKRGERHRASFVFAPPCSIGASSVAQRNLAMSASKLSYRKRAS